MTAAFVSLAPAQSASAPSATNAGAELRSQARRRRALLQLARRHGEVRLRVGDGLSAPAGAVAVSELLDGLNEDGLLRYGGLRLAAGGCELLYLPA